MSVMTRKAIHSVKGTVLVEMTVEEAEELLESLSDWMAMVGTSSVSDDLSIIISEINEATNTAWAMRDVE